jgi:hypothetical protein
MAWESGPRENHVMLTGGRMLMRCKDWPGALHAYQRGLAAGRRVQATVRRHCRRGQWRTQLGAQVYAGARDAAAGAGQSGSDDHPAQRSAAGAKISAGGRRGQSSAWADRNVWDCAGIYCCWLLLQYLLAYTSNVRSTMILYRK